MRGNASAVKRGDTTVETRRIASAAERGETMAEMRGNAGRRAPGGHQAGTGPTPGGQRLGARTVHSGTGRAKAKQESYTGKLKES